MHVIHSTNPDHALHNLLTDLSISGVEQPSRNGPVLRYSTPVTTAWSPDLDCISRDPLRDANPFLHFLEAMWMLAGQDDVATVSYLAPNMANYSDDGVTLHGAYGYRWRHWFGYDQIANIIGELKSNPITRRCVLQMWDGATDLEKARQGGLDTPCNTVIYFDPMDGVLNMTVSNRSNDAVWGAYGANVVHMSILHEYISHQVGMAIGTYYQMSNNLHVYLDNPVTARVFADRKSQVNEGSRDEPRFMLFADLTMDDEEFVSSLRARLSLFLSEDPLPISNYSIALATMGALANAFNTYKKTGANAAHDQLSNERIDNVWTRAGVDWLARRPSFTR